MKIKTLVIDDEEGIREILGLHLTGVGHEVVSVGTVGEGLSLLAPDVDLVICDLTLPDMRGPEVVRAIKERAPEVPVVAISGFMDPELVSEVLGSGAADLLRKPFLKESLFAAIDTVLGV